MLYGTEDYPALATQTSLVSKINSLMRLVFLGGFVDDKKNIGYWQQYSLGTTEYCWPRSLGEETAGLVLDSLYKNSTYSVTVHISAVAVLEQKDVVSAQQCIDQTAFQPVVHLYFTSLLSGTVAHTSGLIYHSLHLASLRKQIHNSIHCDKWCVFTACSFPLSNSQQRKRTGESGKKEREKGRNDGGREGAIGKEREGLWGVFLSWREIAL